MKKADSAPLAPITITVPVRQAAEAPGSAARQAFRQAILDVASLREQLRELRAGQAEARRRYWQQVGPVAAAVVAARRALYAPLEEALLADGYFSRQEEAQIRELILGNAEALETRFGEDEAIIIAKYAPRRPAPAGSQMADFGPGSGADSRRETGALPAGAGPDADVPTPSPPPNPGLPPHEQAAEAARARRLHAKAERARRAAAEQARAQQQLLEANAKTIYRQLARAHHPDLEPDPAKQATRTTQMQRIIEAYEADDLYALLQLLAESGPADANASSDAAADADDGLRRYTQALHQQQLTLRQELRALSPGPADRPAGTGRKQELALRQLKRDLRAEAAYVQQVVGLLAGPAGLREVLRELSAAGHGSV